MVLSEKVYILVKTIGFCGRVDCTMAETAFNTCPVIFSGFLDAVIKQFLSKGKLLGKRRKQNFPLKNIRVLVFEVLAFDVLVFEVLVFEVLDLRSWLSRS